MKSSEWKSHWIRGGKCENVTWVGRDVMAWCSGVHVCFYDVVQRTEALHSFVKSSQGEGASCLSGHPNLPVFAFAEKVSNPRILVYTYPTIKLVCECLGGGPSGYLDTAFTEHEYLVTLASFPHFSLIVWSWRTGVRLATVSTHIKDMHDQKITSTFSGQTMLAQYGKQSGQLSIWHVRVAGKIVSLKSKDVRLPHAARTQVAVWNPEPGSEMLGILDESSHVYMMSSEATVPTKIVQTQRCSECTEIEQSDLCWYRGGVVVKTTFCQIRYYKRSVDNHWHKLWLLKLQLHAYVLTSHPFRNDHLFFYTLEGYIMQLEVADNSESTAVPNMVTHLYRGSMYRFMEWIYPWTRHLVVVDNATELSVLETYTGREVGRKNLQMSGSVSQLTARRDVPLVAVTSTTGEFTFVGLCDSKEPTILAQYHLHRDDLDLLKFSYSGNYVATGFSLAGTCFCVSSKVDTELEVIARVEVNRQISDILLYDNLGHLRLFVLCVTSKRAVLGNQILLYDLPIGQNHFTEANYVLELLNGFQTLQYSPISQYQLVGSPRLTRQVQILEIQGWKEVTLLEATRSDHQLRHVKIFTDNRWITTCSRDGIVAVRKGDKLRTRVAMIMPHHRTDLGAVKGIMKPSGDVIVSLGYDGSIVCTQLSDDVEPENLASIEPSFVTLLGPIAKETEWRRRVSKDEYITLDASTVKGLTHPRVNLVSRTERRDQTWVEWKRAEKIAEETREHATTRAEIQNSFAALKAIVTQLMNENETCPDIQQLSVSEFDLDKVSRDQKLKAARDEREDLRCELEWNCAGMDQVSSWIKKFCWDKQQVQGQSINTIFGRFTVHNYPIVAPNPLEASLLSWAQFSKEFVNDVADSNSYFYPWMTQIDKVVVEQQPAVQVDTSVDEKQRIDAMLDEDDEDTVIDEVKLENERMLEGMTTYRFIQQSEKYYSQFELCSSAQMITERQMLRNDVYRLRAYFNKLFKDMYAIKEREMSLVQEKNERIRHIDAELNLMFNRRVPEIPIDPVWDQTETPERLIKVLDAEVKVPPYISPSAQDILDKQAAEANRLRLLLLADDFRERTLMTMMDGVLEVRWEDLIKKDVPKPQCMLTKTPDAYTAEDILAVQQYDKDVETLLQEREKYQRILDVEYSKVNGALSDGIERFRQRLKDFFATRVHVESAILQLRLRYWRVRCRDMNRTQMYESEEKLKTMIAQKEVVVVGLGEEVRKIQAEIVELRGVYEAACNREKLHEKKFKSEFPGLAKTSNDLLMRQYKRRPRAIQKLVPSTYVKEIGKAVANMTKPFFLTGECADYLKGLDALDVRPVTLPPFIDASHWDHLVHLRRNKIESEMRVKSVSIEITEAENTVIEFNKLIANAKAEIDALGDKLNAESQARINFDQDMQVQLVLKLGQIELGSLNEATVPEVILLPRDVIELINADIRVAGALKLKVMKRTINFGRGINFKEWEHKMLKMQIEDLREELYCVERIAVTKEIQNYLKRKARGWKEDKTQQQLERELELLRKNWERRLMDWNHKLEEVEARIKTIRKTNAVLDKKITMMNVGRCEMELQRDVEAEAKEVEYYQRKMNIVVERSRLVRKLQENFSELLVLQTEYELLRLRRFPAFKFFKTLDVD